MRLLHLYENYAVNWASARLPRPLAASIAVADVQPDIRTHPANSAILNIQALSCISACSKEET